MSFAIVHFLVFGAGRTVLLGVYFAAQIVLQWVVVAGSHKPNRHTHQYDESSFPVISQTEKRKKKLVYYAWMTAGVTMLIAPVPAYMVGASLFTTFVSFMILDEME